MPQTISKHLASDVNHDASTSGNYLHLNEFDW